MMKFLVQVHEDPALHLIHVSPELHFDGMKLLYARLDKRWSLCDAVSFILMERLKVNDALTKDHHFEQAGFTRLLKP